MIDGGESPTLATAIGRALRRRCPRCGRSHMFRRWLAMEPACEWCGLRFEREEGYWLGAVALNLLVTEALFVALLVVGIVATWPDVPWTWLLVLLVAVNIVTPILFHPVSRSLWIAIERTARRWDESGG